MSRLEQVEIDPRSIVATTLQIELMALARNDRLSGDDLATAVLLAIARLESRLSDGLMDPVDPGEGLSG
jgi:hypothetical protein